MKIVKEVELEEYRCFDCGRWWACEACARCKTCPFCAKEAVLRAEKRQHIAERSARAMKGAVSRLRRRKS